jgi:hypothetical protein
MERPRVVDDDDWTGVGRMDYQLQEERGLANPAPATMAPEDKARVFEPVRGQHREISGVRWANKSH